MLNWIKVIIGLLSFILLGFSIGYFVGHSKGESDFKAKIFKTNKSNADRRLSMAIICPACGSRKTNTILEEKVLKDDFGNSILYNERVNICLACDSEGDFNNVNDFVIAETLKDLNARTVTSMIAQLAIKNIKFAAFERILKLPFGTVDKWSRQPNNISPEGFALLKAVNKVPKFLEKMDAIKKD